MQPIEWKESFSVGVDIIDEDHKVLIELVNGCLAASANGNLLEINGIFRDLEHYTSFHFHREEEMMAACGYENIGEHKVLHENLISDLDDCRAQALWERTATEDSEFVKFLRTWLFKHILKEDMQYRESMQAHFAVKG